MPDDALTIELAALDASLEEEYRYRPYDGGPALGIFTGFVLAAAFWSSIAAVWLWVR